MNKEEVVQLNKLKRKTGLFFIIVMGVMLICFIFLIQFEVNKEKISASYTAEDTVRKIETQLGRYLENSEMFKNIIYIFIYRSMHPCLTIFYKHFSII